MSFVCGCTCDITEDLPERYCMSCVEDDETLDGRCLLYETIEKKNIQNKIILSNKTDNIEYPCVVVVHEEVVEIIPISEMKDNTKYGY